MIGRRATRGRAARPSPSSSAGRRPSTTSRSSPGRRSRPRSPDAVTRCSQLYVDLGGEWWLLPPDHRRGDRPPAAYDDPAVAGRAPVPSAAGDAVAGIAGGPAAAGGLRRPPRTVRRGRHGPGDPRGRRARLHGLRCGRVGDRDGQAALQADGARRRAPRPRLGRGGAAAPGKPTGPPSSPTSTAGGRGARRAAHRQARLSRLVGGDGDRPSTGRAGVDRRRRPCVRRPGARRAVPGPPAGAGDGRPRQHRHGAARSSDRAR